MTLSVSAHVVEIQRAATYPRSHLFIAIDGHEYFLGHWHAGMTRGQVRTLARAFLRAHPEHLQRGV